MAAVRPRRRFVLCTTPAQGHTAPLLALARRLIHDGHDVVFFTTEHYRDKVEATGARFVPFAAEYDAHDLMVANPERESSSKRGVRGVKDDLRRIFIGPLPGQYRDLRAILAASPPTASWSTPCSSAPSPSALGPRPARPALACIGVMPYASNSRDTAPFGVAFQPGTGPLHRVRNVTMNWATEHFVLADIQRFARRRLAEAGCAGVSRLPHRPAAQGGRRLPAGDRGGIRVPALGPRHLGALRRPDSCPAVAVLRGAVVVGRARTSGRPVVHVTQGTLDNADLGRLLFVTARALAHDDLLVVATTGGPDPEPLRRGLPANVRLERFIPHDLLLPHADVMVTNGGYGGVQQALANGVPLVVAGDSEDKPEVAARVQWSGAGINLHTGRPSPAMVARAVRRVLAATPTAAGPGRSRPRSPRPTLSAPSAACWPSCARPTTQRAGPRPPEPFARRRAGQGRVTVGGMQAESRSGRLRWQRGASRRRFPTRSPTRGCSRISLPASCTGASSTSSSAGTPPRTTPSWPSSSTARRVPASSWSG